MYQFCITHLLITVVLACPYLCLGEARDSVGSTCTSGCGCSQNPPADESPEPSDDDPDCLCHGAVVDADVRIANLDLVTPLTLSWLVANSTMGSTSTVLARFDFEQPLHFPPFSTGRDVCALTCTRLL